MLPTIDSIPARIEEKIRKLKAQLPEEDPGFFAGMLLRVSTLSPKEVEGTERSLGRELPPEFRELLLTYDLGGLELGGIVFGDASDFGSFLRNQVASLSSESVASGGPSALLVVGASDGYLVLLDSSDGKVYACLKDAPIEERRVVAADFARFFRGLATLFLEEDVADDEGFARRLAASTGSDPTSAFWLHRVKGFA